jgi:broad specificity phosphatase PhoE
MTTDIYFVRHGESTANKDKICAGHLDVELTELGEAQAKYAGSQLKDDGVIIDKIVSSPLHRALKTAQIIAQEIDYDVKEIIVLESAIERYRGDYEGQPSSMQEGATEQDYARMGAESVDSMIERSNKLRSQVNKLGVKTVLVVSHNQFGRIFVATSRGEPAKAELGKIPNAEVFKV